MFADLLIKEILMTLHLTWIVLKLVSLYFLLPYVVFAIVFLLTAKLDKDSEGNLTFDPTRAWHFKVAYPFRRFSDMFVKHMQKVGTSICPYCLKLFWMSFVGWPGL